MTNLDGLWLVQFASNYGDAGAGVVVISGTSIKGGDASYYYVGNLTETGDHLKGTITVKHFSGMPNSVFGNLTHFHLLLDGKAANDGIELHATLKENPHGKMVARLRKVA